MYGVDRILAEPPVLLIFAHPYPDRSIANRKLALLASSTTVGVPTAARAEMLEQQPAAGYGRRLPHAIHG
jgi:hypothetical protein